MKSLLARLGTVTLLLILLQLQLHAEVSLPAIIGDGMVLQRDETINVWGWAEPGERVTVKFKNLYNKEGLPAAPFRIIF